MAIYYPTGVFTDEQLSKPIIFEQHYIPVNIIASSETTGFSAQSLKNELTYERWKPTTIHPNAWCVFDFGLSRTINYCAIFGVGLTTRLVQVTYGDTTSTGSVAHQIYPDQSQPVLLIFPPVTARYFAIVIWPDTNAIPSISTAYFGTYLQMHQRIEVGISPISLSRKTIYSGNTSEGGNWLGRSIKRTGKVGQIPLKAMDRSWYQSTLDPALQRMRYKPFFFASCPLAMPWDVSYCWLTDDPKPVTVGGMLMDVTLNVEAHGHE